MSLIEKAKACLSLDSARTCAIVFGTMGDGCLRRDASVVGGEEMTLVSSERGVKPVMRWIKEGRNLRGASVADKVVGRAVAFLFVYAGVAEIYGEIISEGAFDVLKKYDVKVSFGKIVKNILRRDGMGLCPMEDLVKNLTDVGEAYSKLKAAVRL